jgi:hypothetical protein
MNSVALDLVATSLRLVQKDLQRLAHFCDSEVTRNKNALSRKVSYFSDSVLRFSTWHHAYLRFRRTTNLSDARLDNTMETIRNIVMAVGQKALNIKDEFMTEQKNPATGHVLGLNNPGLSSAFDDLRTLAIKAANDVEKTIKDLAAFTDLALNATRQSVHTTQLDNHQEPTP